jgi:hypothetical protein
MSKRTATATRTHQEPDVNTFDVFLAALNQLLTTCPGGVIAATDTELVECVVMSTPLFAGLAEDPTERLRQGLIMCLNNKGQRYGVQLISRSRRGQLTVGLVGA